MNNTQPNWIANFRQTHGRPPRILHIGNICNNAYQIAKMLNTQGADCDVLSVDYYHFMGAPEWDEADFEGDMGNPLYPSWHKVDLKGYVRPRWFALGPQKLACAYLLARRKGETAKATHLWQKLERYSRYLAFRESSFLKPLLCAFAKARDAGGMFLHFLFASPALLKLKLKRLSGRTLSDAELTRMRQLEGTQPLIDRVLADTALFPDKSFAFDSRLDDFAADAIKFQALFSQYDLIHGFSADPVWPYLAGTTPYVAYENGTLRYLREDASVAGRLLMLAYARAKAVMVTNTDCWASAVAIAKPAGTPLVHALHGIDVTRMIAQLEKAKAQGNFDGRFGIPKDIPLFFSPARHTWDETLGVFLKGEDQAVRAAARLAKEGYRFKFILSRWGSDVERMEQFTAQMPELSSMLEWREPVEKSSLLRIFSSVDAVLDQFYLEVFGAIAFEVLSASQALLISKSVAQNRMVDFFKAPLPYAACTNEEDIYHAMKQVLDTPDSARRLAQQGRQWIESYHSSACILQRCYTAYALALAPEETA